MIKSRLGLVVVSLLLLSSRAASAEPRTYAVDATRSRIVVHVGKAGVFGFAGHEHEVLAPVNRGAVVVDTGRLGASSVDVRIDARALRVTGRGEPPKDVAQVQETMVGPACLDAGRFPEIRFVSKAIGAKRHEGSGIEVTVQGTLTLHGVSRDVTLPIHLDIEGDLLSAQGTLPLRQTDFGIKPISKAGVVKVEDEVHVELRLVARRAP
jgi:polyisoprenoid-binding protein YceI